MVNGTASEAIKIIGLCLGGAFCAGAITLLALKARGVWAPKRGAVAWAAALLLNAGFVWALLRLWAGAAAPLLAGLLLLAFAGGGRKAGLSVGLNTLKYWFPLALFAGLFVPEAFGLPEDIFGGMTPRSAWNEIRGLDPGWFVLWMSFAALVKLAGIFANIVRWRLLLRGQGAHIPFWYLIKCWFWGRAIGLWLPGTLGLDGYRLVESSRYTGEVIKCATVLVVDKLIGFIALFTLVFLTLPLGLRLFEFNYAALAGVLLTLAIFVTVCFLLLLNPRIIQAVAAAVPAPGAVRAPINKLGQAVTAYSGQRGTLIAALLLGVCGHLGICFMYFGTATAMRAENTPITDILFVSPLVIVSQVFGPTVSGAGVREIVFSGLLGPTAGHAKAAVFGHLGLWAGEIIPFLLSLPLLMFTGQPKREELLTEAQAVRDAASKQHLDARLTEEEIQASRNMLINSALAGLGGGLLGGALIGLGEAGWLAWTLDGLSEYGLFAWGTLVYSVLFTGVGLGAAAALAFLNLLTARYARGSTAFAWCLGATLTTGVLVIGVFRFKRDVLAGHAISPGQLAGIGAAALVCGAVAAALALWGGAIARRRQADKRAYGALAGLALYALALGAGYASSALFRPGENKSAFTPAAKASGPNIILIAADALRADYLPMYARHGMEAHAASARTPNLETLASDSVLFEKAFAQSSWTKPSFATLFTSDYPEAHTAATKTSALPDDMTTLAESLAAGGYYTQGFANNPNITRTFNFGQGFAEYVDLKPDLYFRATPSASNLSLYGALRKARQVVEGKLFKDRMRVTDFYQPAETVTALALEWLDSAPPKDAPFFLFLHYMDPHDPFMDWEHPGIGYARVRMEHPDPEKHLDKMRRAYTLEIEYMDRHIGELLDGLKSRGLYEDALIVFTSDHGEEFYDHEGWWHGQTLFDELIHVPLILKLPGNSGAGTRNGELAGHVDVAPTLLSVAGITPPAAMKGRALINAGGVTAHDSAGFVYAEVDFEGNNLQAVRTKEHKLIHANADNPRKHAPVELYDMARDPLERKNIAGKGGAAEAQLEKTLNEMQAHIQQNAAAPLLLEGLPPDLREQLESVGYLGN